MSLLNYFSSLWRQDGFSGISRTPAPSLKIDKSKSYKCKYRHVIVCEIEVLHEVSYVSLFSACDAIMAGT